MDQPREATLLRIFVGEQEKSGHAPLYEAVVLKAREAGLAGVTVLRGPLGYGRSARLHSAKILDLSQDLPMVIEIVDDDTAIQSFLPVLEQLGSGMLVTLEKVRVLRLG